MAISETVIDAIETEIEDRVSEETERIESLYLSTIDRLENELYRYQWMELPDYKLMQYQKDAIKRAIDMILSGEMEMFS